MSDHRNAPTEDVHELVGSALVEGGQRYTSGRKRLVDLLLAASRPVSLPDLLASNSGLPQSSIYRNLEALEQQGLVRRINVGEQHARYELAEVLLGHHHHLICISCGLIEDMTLDEVLETGIEASMENIAASANFEMTGHSVDLHGRCAECNGV